MRVQVRSIGYLSLCVTHMLLGEGGWQGGGAAAFKVPFLGQYSYYYYVVENGRCMATAVGINKKH